MIDRTMDSTILMTYMYFWKEYMLFEVWWGTINAESMTSPHGVREHHPLGTPKFKVFTGVLLGRHD